MMSLYKTRELVDALQADINREMDRARRRASEVAELRAQRDEQIKQAEALIADFKAGRKTPAWNKPTKKGRKA
jgi:hypothetical protein